MIAKRPKRPKPTRTSKKKNAVPPRVQARDHKRITAAQADKLARGKWFTGYADSVPVLDTNDLAGDFDAALIEESGGCVVFEGLSVGGLLRTDFHRAILAVAGDLTVGRLILGDAVLVVTGKVKAKEFVAIPFNEGIFAVGGKQKLEQLAALVETPWLLARDRNKRETRLFAASTKGRPLVELSDDDVDATLLDDGELDYERIFACLRAGKSPRNVKATS